MAHSYAVEVIAQLHIASLNGLEQYSALPSTSSCGIVALDLKSMPVNIIKKWRIV